MTTPDTGPFENTPFRLSNEERGRLRPTVDSSALEAFLAVIPRHARPVVLLAFTRAEFVTPIEYDGALRSLGVESPFERDPQSRSFVLPMPKDFVSSGDPAIDRLWKAIEPEKGTGAG